MPTSPPRLKTYVYIDGFNLYYGCFRPPAPSHWSRYKWLNLEKFCDRLFPDNDVIAIRYYTADVANRPPDNRQSTRQQAYLKALSTLSRVEIVKGHFIGPKKRWMQQCDESGVALGRSVLVLKTEEKGSDVNLAVDLLHDCVKDRYECAAVISNDSDLARAIRIAREDYGKIIGIVNPSASHNPTSRPLERLRHFDRPIRETILASSQFPDLVPIGTRVVSRPHEWR